MAAGAGVSASFCGHTEPGRFLIEEWVMGLGLNSSTDIFPGHLLVRKTTKTMFPHIRL